MKYLLLAFILLTSLFTSCNNGKGTSDFASVEKGEVTGDTYQNQSLGMTMQVPKGWVVKSNPTEDAVPGQSELAQRLKRKKRLFFICKEKFNCNNSLLGVVQDTSYARGANTNETYFQYLIDQLEVQHKDLKIKGHYQKGTKELGGKEFATLSLRREDSQNRFLALEKTIYFRIEGPLVIQITQNAENKQDMQLLTRTLENIKFE